MAQKIGMTGAGVFGVWMAMWNGSGLWICGHCGRNAGRGLEWEMKN